MSTYYYDDDCLEDHWTEEDFKSDEQAKEWGMKLRKRFHPDNCIVYRCGSGPVGGPFTVVWEWNS